MATRYNYTGGIVTNGLVLNLDAAKTDSYPGTGTTWRDLSGNSNNGTLTNGPTFSGIGKQASIVFDGTNDYVNCGNNTTLNLNSSFTLNCWFKVSNSAPTTNDGKGIVAKFTGITANRSYMLFFIGSTNTLSFIISSDGTNTVSTAKSISYSSISRETWYNLTGVFTVSQKLEMFLNGTLVSSDTTTLNQVFSSSTEPLTIGAQAISVPGFYFLGTISSTQIYNRALSATEVSQNFNALRGRYGI
jgi:hypothetical protein